MREHLNAQTVATFLTAVVPVVVFAYPKLAPIENSIPAAGAAVLMAGLGGFATLWHLKRNRRKSRERKQVKP